MRHPGQCHCGAIRFALESDAPLAARACQCSFCRKHGARTLSDPEGHAEIDLPADAIRYRFASRSADYLICARCGSYVGAIASLDGGWRATLNLNAFDDPRPDLAAAPVSYDGEGPAAKAARRLARWTPLALAL